MPANGALKNTLNVPEEGSLPRLHYKGKVFVENLHLVVPFQELLPVGETASLRDNLIVQRDEIRDAVRGGHVKESRQRNRLTRY